jgi:hypothetical protein
MGRIHCEHGESASLSPKDAFLLMNLAENYGAADDFEHADRLFDRAIECAELRQRAHRQGDAGGRFERRSVRDRQTVGANPAGAGSDAEGTFGRAYLLMLQRKFHDAVAILNNCPAAFAAMTNRKSISRALFTLS